MNGTSYCGIGEMKMVNSQRAMGNGQWAICKLATHCQPHNSIFVFNLVQEQIDSYDKRFRKRIY
jgi:hypothetical protein